MVSVSRQNPAKVVTSKLKVNEESEEDDSQNDEDIASLKEQ